METILEVVAIRALGALLLGLGVMLGSRWIERPAVIHALWIVVLLELVVPPVFEIGVLPRSEPPRFVHGAPVIGTPHVTAIAEDPSVARPAIPVRSRILNLALSVWLIGAIGLLLVSILRLSRFRRSLRGARPAPATLQAAADRLARSLGLERSPSIRLVPSRISPLVRGGLGRPEILFPTELLGRLTRAERDALLAHELVHVVRKDPWVRYLEWVAGLLFWWHPVVGWARRRLRIAEELCCDARVVSTLPGHARDYARGLIKTVEFMAGVRTSMPLLTSGIGEVQHLEERLTMIVKHRTPKSPTPTQRVLLVLGALLVLAVVPTWADRDGDRDEELRQRELAFERARVEVSEAVLALEHEALELEQQIRHVRLRQEELRHELARQRESAGIGLVEQEAERLAVDRMRETLQRMGEEGRHDVRREIEMELIRLQEQLGRDGGDRCQALRDEIAALAAEVERLEARGRHDEAERLREQIRRIELEHEMDSVR